MSLHSGHRSKNAVDNLERTFLEAIVSPVAAVQLGIGCIGLASAGISGSGPESHWCSLHMRNNLFRAWLAVCGGDGYLCTCALDSVFMERTSRVYNLIINMYI